jgi:O-acetyl-ADP-ribose deacetylase
MVEQMKKTSSEVAARMQVVQGDITSLVVDAIVNAANETLLGGGGVDGAIHRAAGPRLLDECQSLGGCPTGQAKITSAYDLKAKRVIHTVGPVYQGGKLGEAELLSSCYRQSLRLARDSNLQSIAFPCISTGIYGYPIHEACEIAVSTVMEWLQTNSIPSTVLFCCYSLDDADVYRHRLSQASMRSETP